MDGFDLITRLKIVRGHLVGAHTELRFDEKGKSLEMSRFVTECRRRGLPLNEGKSVMQSFCASILGGELDGVAGVLMHSREKGFRMFNRSLALLSLPEVPQVSCQHWAGLFCFMAQFRRPTFSAVQEIFPFIMSLGEAPSERRALPLQVFDEILLGALLAPLAFSNLRCQVRSRISISDASEEAGASAEASFFLPYFLSFYGSHKQILCANFLFLGLLLWW